MSLTGPTFGWLAWMLAIGMFVWAIVAWPRAAGPGWPALLRRVGYQLGMIALVLLAVAVSLNDEYGWYANWDDLGAIVGVDSRPGNIASAGAAASSAAASHGRGLANVPLGQVAARERQLHLSGNPGPAGQYRDYVIPGPISNMDGKITVWFPAAYTDASQRGRRFPVLMAFHGIPGSPHQFSVNLHLGQAVAAAVAAGHLTDPVVVMPNFSPNGRDTECVDGDAGKLRMETWLVDDVTSWVVHNLRVGTARTSWATIGFSAGAWCASMLAMLHPDRYCAAVSLGGYFEPTFQKSYVPFGAGSPPARRYDLLRLARERPPSIALWVQTSKLDGVSYHTTEQLLRDARPPLSVTADVLAHAGHRLTVWSGLLPQTLQWLGATAPGFHRAPLLPANRRYPPIPPPGH